MSLSISRIKAFHRADWSCQTNPKKSRPKTKMHIICGNIYDLNFIFLQAFSFFLDLMGLHHFRVEPAAEGFD